MGPRRGASCELDRTWRRPGGDAKVSALLGRLRGTFYRLRYFAGRGKFCLVVRGGGVRCRPRVFGDDVSVPPIELTDKHDSHSPTY